MAELTRRDRLQAAARLDAIAGELDAIGGWLDRFGDDADKAACLIACATRDLLAAAWVVKPASHDLPEGWLSRANGHP